MAFTFSKLATVSVGSGGAATISFLNIPQNYKDLVIKLSNRTTIAAIYASDSFTLNSSTTGYSFKILSGNGASASSASGTGGNFGYIDGDGASATANTFGNVEIYIPNYTSSNNKSISVDAINENNATTAYATLSANLWSSPTAISSIIFTANGSSYAQYTTATLYGIRAEV
jgi:hypothetical protein